MVYYRGVRKSRKMYSLYKKTNYAQGLIIVVTKVRKRRTEYL